MNDEDRLIELAGQHGRDPGAYRLLMITMGYALENMQERRHLSGSEFLDWLVKMLEDRFGYMGRWLLVHYGFEKPEEVGKAIFELVEAGVFSRREEDTMDDFRLEHRLTDRIRVEFEKPEWWENEGPDWRFLPVLDEGGHFT